MRCLGCAALVRCLGCAALVRCLGCAALGRCLCLRALRCAGGWCSCISVALRHKPGSVRHKSIPHPTTGEWSPHKRHERLDPGAGPYGPAAGPYGRVSATRTSRTNHDRRLEPSLTGLQPSLTGLQPSLTGRAFHCSLFWGGLDASSEPSLALIWAA